MRQCLSCEDEKAATGNYRVQKYADVTERVSGGGDAKEERVQQAFAGHSKKALKAAKRWRDLMLRVLPNKRRKPIPKKILAAVGLKNPAVGVFRYAKRRLYYVSYRDRKRAVRSRTFPWSDDKGESAAYAAAVRFRKKATTGK